MHNTTDPSDADPDRFDDDRTDAEPAPETEHIEEEGEPLGANLA